MMSQNDNILVNRVANSGLITIKLEDFLPQIEIEEFDVKDYLFQGLILKEKDFRLALKNFDWSTLSGKVLVVHCSADAIVPVWAYMLISTYASPQVQALFMGSKKDYIKHYVDKVISTLDVEKYSEKRVVIKGCSDQWVPESAYMQIAYRLQPVVQSLMYGEPCSTVPIFKRPRNLSSKK